MALTRNEFQSDPLPFVVKASGAVKFDGCISGDGCNLKSISAIYISLELFAEYGKLP